MESFQEKKFNQALYEGMAIGKKMSVAQGITDTSIWLVINSAMVSNMLMVLFIVVIFVIYYLLSLFVIYYLLLL
jgi:hypothetical protein